VGILLRSIEHPRRPVAPSEQGDVLDAQVFDLRLDLQAVSICSHLTPFRDMGQQDGDVGKSRANAPQRLKIGPLSIIAGASPQQLSQLSLGEQEQVHATTLDPSQNGMVTQWTTRPDQTSELAHVREDLFLGSVVVDDRRVWPLLQAKAEALRRAEVDLHCGRDRDPHGTRKVIGDGEQDDVRERQLVSDRRQKPCPVTRSSRGDAQIVDLKAGVADPEAVSENRDPRIPSTHALREGVSHECVALSLSLGLLEGPVVAMVYQAQVVAVESVVVNDAILVDQQRPDVFIGFVSRGSPPVEDEGGRAVQDVVGAV
jgi:hypothetical protein